MTDPVGIVSEFFAGDMSESDTVKSCEIGGDFTRDDDIVRSESVVSRGERDFDELSSEVCECFFGLFDDFSCSGFDTFTEVFFRESDFDSFQVCAIPDIWRDFDSTIERRRIERVVTLHSIPDEVSISDSAREDAHRIERGCHRDDTVARDSSVGSLESDDTRERRRLTDTSACISRDRDRSHA
jgi:hypothetical protein